MKIEVKVKTRSKIEKVVEVRAGFYEVAVNTPPIEGRANERVIELLAEHFKKPKSKIELVRGHKSKVKVFEII